MEDRGCSVARDGIPALTIDRAEAIESQRPWLLKRHSAFCRVIGERTATRRLFRKISNQHEWLISPDGQQRKSNVQENQNPQLRDWSALS